MPTVPGGQFNGSGDHGVPRQTIVLARTRGVRAGHVAARAIPGRLLRIIKAARAMPGHTAQQVSVVMVLTAQELLVLVQLLRNADFMARRAKFRRPVERLQEALLVEIRLGFDNLVVDPLQDRIVAGGKRVMHRFFDRIVAIAGGAVNVGDGVTNGTSDAGMCRWMAHFVEILIIELPGEKGHGIMTTGAPA